MSQQHQQPYHPPPRAFSPMERMSSPQGSSFPLDSKRPPHYSPPLPSPYGSPAPTNIALPNQLYSGSPYYGGQVNGAPHGNSYPPSSPYSATSPYAPHPTFNTMNARPAPSPAPAPQQNNNTGTMGPPSRPVDNKPTDINDLGDVLSGSGIDLREEEAAMYKSYQGSQQQEPSQTMSRPYPFPRDNYYSANVPGDRQGFFGAGNLSQPAGPYQSLEAIAEIERKKAIRRKEEIRQYHLNQPFLLTGILRRRFDEERNKSHVRFDDSSFWTQTQRLSGPPREYRISGPDKNEVVRVLQNEEILSKDSTLAEVLALISLATEERLRILIEDSAVIARSRRVGSLGLAPPDLSEEAAANGETANGLPTPSNSAVSPNSGSLKRSYAEVNKPLTPVSNKSQPSLAFTPPTNHTAQALQDAAKKERALEEERLAKRQKRKSAAAGNAGSLEAGASAGISKTQGEVAPDVDVKKAGPKRAKDKMDNATKDQQIAALNKTTQMALGGKQLSWMRKGPDTGPSNPYLARPNASSQKAGTANDGAGQIPKARSFGDFREDKEGGKGIQVRDLLSALESYDKEKKSIQKAYSKLMR